MSTARDRTHSWGWHIGRVAKNIWRPLPLNARIFSQENHQRLAENSVLGDETRELCSHETRKTTRGVYVQLSDWTLRVFSLSLSLSFTTLSSTEFQILYNKGKFQSVLETSVSPPTNNNPGGNCSTSHRNTGIIAVRFQCNYSTYVQYGKHIILYVT